MGQGGTRTLLCPLGLVKRQGGRLSAGSGGGSSFPRGGSVRKTAPHVPPHMLLLERLEFPLISFPKRDAGR